jgi:hypothetical protein
MFDEKAPEDRDALGYLRFRDWPSLTEAVLFIRDKHERPPLDESLTKALLWAVQGFRTPQIGEYLSGWAAYETWAQALQDDTRWTADDLKALKQAADAHFFATLTVAEGRAFGAEAPERLAKLRPEVADDLHVAEGSYYLMHDLVWRLWQTVEGTIGPADPPLRFTDPAVRRELARLVLLERDLDASAAAHLERALLELGVGPEEMPAPSEVERQEAADIEASLNRPGADPSRMVHAGTDGTWADGTLALGWLQGKDCTFIGALESALAPTACPYSYTDLMGYSGLAFRTRWFHNPTGAATPWGTGRWHPISPHGEGPEELAALSQATGWQFRREDLPEDRNDPAYQHLITDLVLSVNAGLPAVIGLNTDIAAVYGYHIWSMNLILRDYRRPDQENVRTQANDAGFHSPVIFLERHDDPPDPHAALLASLALAARNANRDPSDGFEYGLAALRTWHDDLLAYDTYTDAERNLLFLTNWWSLMHLADARASAVALLEANADLLTGDSQTALLRALDSYKEEARLLRQFADEHLDFIQWYGGTKQAKDWDPQTLQSQADLLASVAELETAALKACEEVLALEGKHP